jgi:hypothetical protein
MAHRMARHIGDIVSALTWDRQYCPSDPKENSKYYTADRGKKIIHTPYLLAENTGSSLSKGNTAIWTSGKSGITQKQGEFYSLSSNFATGHYKGRILGRNWDKSLKSFPHCYSLTDFTPPPPPPTPRKSGLKLVCNVNIVYGNLKSENSQDYVQKPQRNCTFMNSASVHVQ